MTTTESQAERAIVAGRQQLSVHGEAKALYAGAVHYWRLEREAWEPVVASVKQLGFAAISIYIPWEVHETARGEFRFDGNRDVDAFLSLVEENGLDIVVRPGPQINAELTDFGYPHRILADRRLHALNGQGTAAVLTQVPRPIPALCYAEDAFFEEVALWYDAICPILARHAHPKGRLLAAQVDNEMAYFFHVNAYAADYHPASISRFRSFLAGSYGDVERLNAAYGTTYRSFDEVEPPRRYEAREKRDIVAHTDWVAYRERYLVDAIGRLAEMLRERGLSEIALFHNYPHPLGPGGAASGFTTPFAMSELEEQIDFVGFDVYSRKELYDHVKTLLSYVVGTSRFPYIPEFIAGVWPWYLDPGDLSDEEFVTKAGLMQGIKGFSRYMLVERDRWLDSPIRADGRIRPGHGEMFGRANDVAIGEKFVELRRVANVLLLANRDYDRLEAASVLVSFPGDFLETPSGFSEYPSFLTVSERPMGFDRPIQMAKNDWFVSAKAALQRAGLAYLISDTALPADRLAGYDVAVVSSFAFMGRELQRKLVHFAEQGGTVVLGPQLPNLDEHMHPDETLVGRLRSAPHHVAGDSSVYAVGKGRIVHVPDGGDLEAALEVAAEGRPIVRFRRDDERLDVAVHAPVGGGSRRLVYVANPTADRISAEISLSPEVTFVREVWEDREVKSDSTLREEFAPYSVSIYEARLETGIEVE